MRPRSPRCKGAVFDFGSAVKSGEESSIISLAPHTGRFSNFYGPVINGGAIIDHEAPRERRFVAVQK